MKRIATLFLFFAILAPCWSQPQEEAAIAELSWNEFYKIQWDDFQGKPDENSNGDAATAVQIKAKPYLVKKDIHYTVDAYFSRKKSWVRDPSPSLLAHEQLHFDIAELYARKIRKRIRDLQQRGENDIKVYNAEIQKLLNESNEADERYDLETLHGALSKKQAAWVEKVKGELADLKRYRKVKRVIGG